MATDTRISASETGNASMVESDSDNNETPDVKNVEDMTDRELLIEMVTTCRALAESFGAMAGNPMIARLSKMFGG